MLQIIGVFIAGLGLGFCIGGLYELRNTQKAINAAREIGEKWRTLAQKNEKEWSDYCKKLLKDNEELQKECNEHKANNLELENGCKALIQEYEAIIEGLRGDK